MSKNLVCAPCPHCGGQAEIVEEVHTRKIWKGKYGGDPISSYTYDHMGYFCRCEECEFESPSYREVEPAIRAWNNEQVYVGPQRLFKLEYGGSK